jgi:hypothetical protein
MAPEPVTGDILIDCTNDSGRFAFQQRKTIVTGRRVWRPDFIVGPYASDLDYNTQRTVEGLGIKSNTGALWATMALTDRTSAEVVRMIPRT